MRYGVTSLVAIGWLIAGVDVLSASEMGPVIVIPGRFGVPVVINGRDASFGVVEGDWGLARPSQIDPVVIYKLGPPIHYFPGAANYFPSAGRQPKVGRKEVDMPSTNPEPAQTYIRTWGVESAPTPATSPTNYDMPPVIVSPQLGGGRQQRKP